MIHSNLMNIGTFAPSEDNLQIDGPFLVRIKGLADLSLMDREAWAALSNSATKTNIFAEHWFLNAGLKHFDLLAKAKLFIVQSQNGQWIGAIALNRMRRFGRIPFAHWKNWKHANQFLGTPLVRKGHEIQFWDAVLNALDQRIDTGFAFQCTDLPTDDPIFEALVTVCKRQMRPLEFIQQSERAALLTNLSFDHYWSLSVSKKCRARINSLMQRLHVEHGTPFFEKLSQSDDVTRWINQFLELEHGGWKGRNKSSLQSQADTQSFFRSIITNAFAAGQLEFLALSVNGRTIAMSAHFIADGCGYGFKMAYDENYGAYAPGLLLMREITKTLISKNGIFFDSCCNPDQHSINTLWMERRRIVDVCISIKGWRQQKLFSIIMTARKIWHRSKL